MLAGADAASAQGICQTTGVLCPTEVNNTDSVFLTAHPLQFGCFGAELVVMSDVPATVKVELPAGCALPVSNCAPPVAGRYCITPCNPISIGVCAGIMIKTNETRETDREIRITEVTGVVPQITAVLHYPNAGDAMLLLPPARLGSQYLAIGFTGEPQASCGVPGHEESFRWAAVASQDDTRFQYEGCDGVTRTTPDCYALGDSIQLVCDLHNKDITGNFVRAFDCGPGLTARSFVLMGGTECSQIPLPQVTTEASLLESQLPVGWGGKKTLVAPLSHGTGAENEEIIRVVNVSMVPTTVEIVGGAVTLNTCSIPPATLLAGARCSFELEDGAAICSSENIQVVQYHKARHNSTGTLIDGKGNPSMVMVVPAEKWRCHHRFYSFLTYSEKHVTIVAPDTARANTRLNGVAVGSAGWTSFLTSFPTCVGAFSWRDFTGSDVLPGENTVDGVDDLGQPSAVGVIVHAYAGGTGIGMYSYPGGLSF